jgi:hypothetical protein
VFIAAILRYTVRLFIMCLESDMISSGQKPGIDCTASVAAAISAVSNTCRDAFHPSPGLDHIPLPQWAFCFPLLKHAHWCRS